MVRAIRELLDSYDCITRARHAARYFAGAALQEFGVAYGDLADSQEKAFLRDIVMYMIQREY